VTAGDVVTVSAPTASPVRHFGAGVLAGLSALLLAWILLIPPFGGTDEFDHAYRAAAVARGQWFATPSDATRGTGAWLEVPRDIVDAARPECQVRSYTTAADCVGTAHGDTVRIASGAGRYQPVFYAVVKGDLPGVPGDPLQHVGMITQAKPFDPANPGLPPPGGFTAEQKEAIRQYNLQKAQQRRTTPTRTPTRATS